MTNQHPVTPPPDKIHNWLQLEKVDCTLGQIITIAAQWGADQELEACGRWIEDQLCMSPDARADVVTKLNGSRRPKPPSLKEQALEQLGCIQADLNKFGMGISTDTIRRAIEALPE
jgi:hypothetical protein